MLKIAMMTALGVGLVLPAASEAAQRARSGKVSTSAARYAHNQAPASCAYCYTCGGDWQVLAGYFYNYGGYVLEYQSQCSGSWSWQNDYYPYLCCN
jgi:hypothetical protein